MADNVAGFTMRDEFQIYVNVFNDQTLIRKAIFTDFFDCYFHKPLSVL